MFSRCPRAEAAECPPLCLLCGCSGISSLAIAQTTTTDSGYLQTMLSSVPVPAQRALVSARRVVWLIAGWAVERLGRICGCMRRSYDLGFDAVQACTGTWVPRQPTWRTIQDRVPDGEFFETEYTSLCHAVTWCCLDIYGIPALKRQHTSPFRDGNADKIRINAEPINILLIHQPVYHLLPTNALTTTSLHLFPLLSPVSLPMLGACHLPLIIGCTHNIH